MNRFLKGVFFCCVLLSLSAYAEEDAMQILDRMRVRIEKEEAEVAEYYEIMGEEKARPSIMDEQKAEVTEQTSQAETSQEEIQTTEVKQ